VENIKATHTEESTMRKILLRTILVLAATSFLCRDVPLAAAQNKARVDVTGKWAFDVTTSAGSGKPIVTFKQAGETLTGHYSSMNFGEADLNGTVKGQDIAFKFVGTVQGTSIDVSYAGTIESDDAIRGTIDIGGLARGTFTAKRQ
jgi:hypothetical protein